MSFLNRLSKDKAGTILFLTSLSVILITLGIIQTLLFETITFFTDIAEHRGWFSLDWDVGGIFSASGFACLLLVVALLLDHESKKEKNRLSHYSSRSLESSPWSCEGHFHTCRFAIVV